MHPLIGTSADYDPLLERIGKARIVLLGEASHGTHEFYRARADITRRLILEKGFRSVAVEADWPDAWRVNQWVRGERGDDPLGGFERFPRWMWRNTDVRDFVRWLRGREVGFFGLDLYSLNRSIQAVLEYLDKTDPEAALGARHRYSCFDHYGDDSQAYGYNTAFGLEPSCEQAVVEQLRELQRQDGSHEDFFSAEQNAILVRDAERYYRAMFEGRASTWNLRDRHMAETVDRILEHRGGRIVVWAHNSHLGDARATDMRRRGEQNVGEFVRARYGKEAVLIGFTTYDGTVRASDNWDEPDSIHQVRPGLPGSYEALFHEWGVPDFLALTDDLKGPMLERAIGVIYRPRTERLSHYFEADISKQFDAVIHFDRTRAVVALGDREATAAPLGQQQDAPETYPSGV